MGATGISFGPNMENCCTQAFGEDVACDWYDACNSSSRASPQEDANINIAIGNSIYGNDDASSVSSAMAAVDFTASDHGDKSDGGAKSGKSKSDKSSGVSCVEYVIYFVHMI